MDQKITKREYINQLEEYRKIKAKLADLKKTEMDMRVGIAEALSSGENLEAGTHRFDEFEGLKVKLVLKLNYKIDKDVLETLDLTEEEAECIRWKPELALKNYKKADDTSNLDDAITVTDGAPELEVSLDD